jgi:hypothetical protein
MSIASTFAGILLSTVLLMQEPDSSFSFAAIFVPDFFPFLSFFYTDILAGAYFLEEVFEITLLTGVAF